MVFFLAYFVRVIPDEPWLTWASYLGLLLVIAAVAYDATRARLPMWWAVAGAIPLIGWWAYAVRRVPEPAVSAPQLTRSWFSVLDIFTARHVRLVTSLSPEQCATALRAKTQSWGSPRSWFARSSSVPFLGQVSPRRFSLKIRHVMTRPTMLDEARGTFSSDGTATRIDLRIGVSTFDRALAFALVGFLLLWSVAWIAARHDDPLSSAGFPVLELGFMILILVLVTALVRAVGINDGARLYEIIATTLDAHAADGERA